MEDDVMACLEWLPSVGIKAGEAGRSLGTSSDVVPVRVCFHPALPSPPLENILFQG